MAHCPSCNAEISFLLAFTPGGRFQCPNCQTVIQKRINNEMMLVFPCIVSGFLSAFAALGFLSKTSLSKITLFLLTAVFALLVAVILVKVIWKYFIKL